MSKRGNTTSAKIELHCIALSSQLGQGCCCRYIHSRTSSLPRDHNTLDSSCPAARLAASQQLARQVNVFPSRLLFTLPCAARGTQLAGSNTRVQSRTYPTTRIPNSSVRPSRKMCHVFQAGTTARTFFKF